MSMHKSPSMVVMRERLCDMLNGFKKSLLFVLYLLQSSSKSTSQGQFTHGIHSEGKLSAATAALGQKTDICPNGPPDRHLPPTTHSHRPLVFPLSPPYTY